MSKLEDKVKLKTDEELSALIEKFETDNQPEKAEATPELVETMLEYVYAQQLLSDFESAGKVFGETKDVIDQLILSEEHKEKGLIHLMEWSLAALHYTPEDRNSFSCYPIYLELFTAYENAPEHLKAREARAAIQLVHHFNYWLTTGGKPELLTPEVSEWMQSIMKDAEVRAETQIEKCEALEDWEEVLSLHKNLARFYRTSGKPNNAVAHRKAVLEVLPKTKDFVEADLADEYFELGKLFYEYKKYSAAHRYFGEAKSIYDTLGEDMEPFQLKAEAWMEESESMM